jgi:hypothetical protein
MRRRHYRRRNPEVSVKRLVTVKRKAVSGGLLGTTEGKIMVTAGIAVAAVVGYFLYSSLSGS